MLRVSLFKLDLMGLLENMVLFTSNNPWISVDDSIPSTLVGFQACVVNRDQ